MGQQQLLLLVLGIVIVGLAVVVGIQAFSENQKKANADALTITGLRIASDAQAYLRKPPAFGGPPPDGTGNRPQDFSTNTALTLSDLGYPTGAESCGTGTSKPATTYCTLDGDYDGVVNGSGEFVITATSATTSGGGDNNTVCVVVSGLTTNDITTTVNAGACS